VPGQLSFSQVSGTRLAGKAARKSLRNCCISRRDPVVSSDPARLRPALAAHSTHRNRNTADPERRNAMLIQMLIHQPQVLPIVLKNTPVWVWGLLAALTALGLSQVRARTASLARVAVLPVVMTGLSLWGTVSAFGHSPQLGPVLLAWAATAFATLAAVAPFAAPRGARFDAASRSFALPGRWVPLLLVLGVFLTKYVVGVDLAMQPGLVNDDRYVLIVGTLYGVFSGVFLGRAAQLWRLAAARTGGNPRPAGLSA
jgi:hypothetical protein